MIEQKKRVHLNLAVLKKGGEQFEVDVDPQLAKQFQQGKPVDIHEVLKAEHVFSDAQKGMLASDQKMQAILGTSDPLEAAKIIIKEGAIQETDEQRAQLREQKRRQIISMISRFGVDPRTKAPHPPVRVEAALEQAKIRIDYNKTAEDQLQEIVRSLQPILPIRFEKRKIELTIPVQYASKAHGMIKTLATILSEEWEADGSWKGTIEVPAGLEEELTSKLAHLTRGGVVSRTLDK